MLGNFLRYEAQPHDPAVLQEALRQEQHSRGRAVPGDFKAHVTALHDSRIETEARRIVDKLKDLSAPKSPNKTHFMVEISPHFDALASTKDNDRLFAMLPYKSLCFTSIKDRHGRAPGCVSTQAPALYPQAAHRQQTGRQPEKGSV